VINLGERADPAPGDDADDSDGAASGDEPRARDPLDRLFLGSVVVALVPIVVAVVRAARSGWLPIGDNGYFAVRAQDVFTTNHPLLGTWTSASLNTDTNFNNPGPLLFDLYALPAKLTNGRIGVAIGAAALNAMAVVGIAIVARRRGGPVLGVAAMAMAAALCLSMGSDLLYDPWQPHSLLLAFLFGLVLIWSLACGDLAALPWAVGVGSLVLQTHLSYAVLITVLGVWGALTLGLSLRRRRRAEPDSWPDLRRSALRAGLVTLVVAAVCWGQPVYEQLTGEGTGNFSRLAANMTSAEETIGIGLGTRAVADVMTVPPYWLPPSFEEAFLYKTAVPAGGDRLTTIDPSAPTAAIMLALLVLILAAAALDAHRRGDHVISAALSTALVAFGAALVTAWKLPMGPLGLPPHQLRWLWPIAGFITFALVSYAIRRADLPARTGRRVAVGLMALTVLVAVLNLPAHNVHAGPSADSYAIDVMKQAGPQMAALEDQGTILVDLDGIRFAEPYTGPVMAELQRRDIPFVVSDEGMVRQLGDNRRLDGDAQRLLFRQGDYANQTPAGARRVVFVEGLTPDEKRELKALRTEVVDYLEDHPIELTPLGKGVLDRPEHEIMKTFVAEDNIVGLEQFGGLKFLIEFDLMVIDPDWQDRLDRFFELQQRWDQRTIGLFLAPLDKEAPS
jgi:hypothetical protein